MKTLVSALVALSVLAGIAAPASAFDAKKFWDEHPIRLPALMRKYARSRFDRHGKGPAPPPGGAFPFLQSAPNLILARRYSRPATPAHPRGTSSTPPASRPSA